MLDTMISNFTLKKIMYIIRKSWLIMVLVALIGIAVGLILAERKRVDTYQANVTFYLYANYDIVTDDDRYVTSSDFTYARNLIDSYMYIMTTDRVLEPVIANNSLKYTTKELARKISCVAVNNTSMFYVYVKDSDPYTAMQIANSLAEVAPIVIKDIAKSGGISVVEYATLPTASYSSIDSIKYGAVGGVAGFMFVLVISLVIGLLDTTIRWRSDLETNFNIPILGEIPEITIKRKGKLSDRVIGEETPFAIKEAYNTLCANVLFTTNGEGCPVYAVTSSAKNEGKSLNSINLAKSMAGFGKKVLLIDADMRNSSVLRELGKRDLDTDEGLSNYLASLIEDPKIVNIDENFDVMPAGTVPPNPAQLLASDRFTDMLCEMKKRYSLIVIDLPPVGLLSDGLLIKDNVLGYVLVVRNGSSKLTQEKSMISELERTDTNVIGFVMNAVNAKGQSYKKYGYSYGYGNNKAR